MSLAVLAVPSVASANLLAAGNVLAGVGTGQIFVFSPTGTNLGTLDTTSGSTEDTGMCFDGAGNLYSTNFEANSMSKFDSSGNLVAASFGSGFGADPESCVFNKADQMYVGQADGSGNVLEFDTSGNSLGTLAPATEDRGTDWVDLAPDQCTLHYTSEGDSIKTFNVCTNTQGPDFATGLPGPCYAHRILSDGGELVACSTVVERVNSSGQLIQTYSPQLPDSSSPSVLFALNVDPDGTSFWTADLPTGQIWRIDIATGNVITTFNANAPVDVAGLAVVGEVTQGGPPPTDPAITATGVNKHSPTGTFCGTVATFTDPDANATAAEYSASINWGDGTTTSAIRITGTPSQFAVEGCRSRMHAGTWPVTVTITDKTDASNTATANSTWLVVR